MRLRRGGTPQRLYFSSLVLVPTPASRGNSVPRPGRVSAHHATGSRPSPCCQKRTLENPSGEFSCKVCNWDSKSSWISSVEETAGGGPGMEMARNGLGNRFGSLTSWAAVAIALATASPARAGTIPLVPSNGVSPPFAADVDELSKSIVEVNEAIKSFQKQDLDTCLQQLAKAVKAHPELPPAHALLAKLALLSNQIALVRPALETAVAQAPDHPEIYILFGNLALLENRATDAALHFEKAKALASAERWTADQRRRFERFCHQGNALLAESRGDWKAARSALEAWLALEPANARARQRLGKALFSLDQQDEAYKELQKASKEDSALEPADVMMGWLYTRAGNLKKAEEWMDYAAKTSPDSLPVQLAITSWLLEQGRADEAQSHAEAAAKLDSKSNQVQRLLGLVARVRKEYGQSEAIFQALALESPGDAS